MYNIFFSENFANIRYNIKAASLKNADFRNDVYDPIPGELKLEYIPFVYNSLYSLNNIKNAENSISILRNFNYLVCGEPAILVDSEIQVANAIKDKVRIFGYVNLGGYPLCDIDKVKQSIYNINKHGWYGVFIDQFGYDFDETRSRQNEVVEYAHSLGLKCFVNAWFIDEALGSQPNKKHNPDGIPTALGKDDWYLLESFYCGNEGYGKDAEALAEKCRKAQWYKDKKGIKIAVLPYKRDAAEWNSKTANDDINNTYLLALLLGFDGYWFTDHTEYDSFIYGKPSLNIGKILRTPLTEYKRDYYYAKTDIYDVLFDFNDYPNISFSFYR